MPVLVVGPCWRAPRMRQPVPGDVSATALIGNEKTGGHGELACLVSFCPGRLGDGLFILG